MEGITKEVAEELAIRIHAVISRKAVGVLTLADQNKLLHVVNMNEVGEAVEKVLKQYVMRE